MAGRADSTSAGIARSSCRATLASEPLGSDSSSCETQDLLEALLQEDLQGDFGRPACRGYGAIQICQEEPLVLHLEESCEGTPGEAEPAVNAVLWLTSEDAEKKWWRVCRADFAAALELQHSRGVATATFRFYPRVCGQIHSDYTHTYFHDLTRMIQVDANQHQTLPLRRVQLLACHKFARKTGGRAPAAAPAAAT